jgi:hypothetical protein
MVSKNSRRLAPSLRIRRALSSSTSARMATFSSASEKKRRSRSRARTQRCAIWTATSTLALSRGLRGRVGTMVVP